MNVHVALMHPGVQEQMLHLKHHYCHEMKLEDIEKALNDYRECVYIVMKELNQEEHHGIGCFMLKKKTCYYMRIM